jgi:NTE family protein
VISPHVVEGRLLADGGILDPVPMGPIAAVNADLTVAVNLSGANAADILAPEDCEDTDGEPSRGSTPAWLTRMLQSTSALMDSNAAHALFGRFGNGDTGPDGETESEPEVPKLGSFEVMNRTIDIAQAALTRHHLATQPPDLLIEVPRTTCRSLDFHCATEIIDIGRKLTAQALDSDQPD